jgi:peptidoglycan/xylan/chitin deacetylase (PgdA/CDA1 family)
VDPLLIAAPSAIAAAGGLIGYASAHPASQLFGRSVRSTNAAKKLAITFDDGPNPAITPKLLDLFARYNAHATFFVIGDFVKLSPELLRETVARGHCIGNHTDNHPNLFKRTPAQIQTHLQRCNEAVQQAADVTLKWFRPPYGLRNPWVIPAANRMNMQAVMWTLLAYDWKAKSKEWLILRMNPIAERAQKNIPAHQNAPGDILCLHDGNHAQQNGDRRCTVEALEYWLPRWRDLGLEFVTIEEAVRTPAT